MTAPEKIAPEDVRLRMGAHGYYARAGEKTYCEFGHLLGIFRKDVLLGQTDHSAMEPVGEMEIGRLGCPYCSGRSNDAGYYWFAAVKKAKPTGASEERKVRA